MVPGRTRTPLAYGPGGDVVEARIRARQRTARVALVVSILLSAVGGVGHARVGGWTKGRRMPVGRVALSAVVVDGTIYAIGGMPAPRDRLTETVDAYDIARDEWHATADMIDTRAAFGATIFDGRVFAAGGCGDIGAYIPNVEAYDPSTGAWTKRGELTHHGRQGLALSVVKGRVYAIGGHPGPQWRGASAAVESYDPTTDLWTPRADMPTARTGLVTGVVNGKIYAIGGGDEDGPSAAVEEYSPATDQWTKKRDMPTPRSYPSAAVVNRLIYVIGGAANDGTSVAVEVYDPGRNRWRPAAELRNPREAAAAVAHEGRIYLLGGQHAGGVAPILDSVLVVDTGFRGPFPVSPRNSVITTWSELKVD